MQQYVIFNVLKEYCIPKEEEEEDVLTRIVLTGNYKKKSFHTFPFRALV